jgi:hypothetical protein
MAAMSGSFAPELVSTLDVDVGDVGVTSAVEHAVAPRVRRTINQNFVRIA